MNQQKTNHDLLLLLINADFDKSRIVIAEHQLSVHFLTLYLEDKHDFKPNLDDTLLYKLPTSQFAAIILSEGYNSYEGTLHTQHDRPYPGRVTINEPLVWWEKDATLYQQKEVLHTALQYILATLDGQELVGVA